MQQSQLAICLDAKYSYLSTTKTASWPWGLQSSSQHSKRLLCEVMLGYFVLLRCLPWSLTCWPDPSSSDSCIPCFIWLCNIFLELNFSLQQWGWKPLISLWGTLNIIQTGFSLAKQLWMGVIYSAKVAQVLHLPQLLLCMWVHIRKRENKHKHVTWIELSPVGQCTSYLLSLTWQAIIDSYALFELCWDWLAVTCSSCMVHSSKLLMVHFSLVIDLHGTIQNKTETVGQC